MPTNNPMTPDELKERLSYDPESGVISWRKPAGRWGRYPEGSAVGYVHSSGYVLIRIGKIQMRAHRVAWAITHGVWPQNEIDHIDGNRANNSLANLREATRQENCQNIPVRRRTKSGLKGASWSGNCRKPWQASIRANGREIYLGRFQTARDAHETYVAAAKRLHGKFLRLA